MSHVDEGTLHALLDGELAPAEVVEVQTHFATCPACSARLDSARKLLAETERLVSALEPSAARGDRLGASAAPPPPPPPPAPPAPVSTRLSPVDSMVLIPNNPTAAEVRRSRLRMLAWAAGVLVVVGAGVFGVQVQMGLYDKRPVGMLRIRPEEFSTPGTVADSVAAARPAVAGAPRPSGPLAQGASTPAPAPAVAAASPRPSAPAPAEIKAQPAPQPSPPPSLANAQGRDRNRPAGQVADAAPTEDREVIAARAAKATQALDRERNEARAAAATAALDSTRRAAAQQQAATPAAPYAPVVPTLDQRAQIANRIGLDEAARQLGGPLHAIDGMARQLVGVVSPQLVPGTDTSRAVVRAVYVDRGGRLIFLDQQRVRPGQTDLPFTPQARRNGELRWMAGQVLVVLQGDLPTDSLRFIARHVR